MNALISSQVILTVLFLSIMLGKKNKVRADNFLVAYLVFLFVRQIYVYIEVQGLLNDSSWMLLGKSHYLLNAPIFFLYVYALTQKQNLSRKWYVVMFIPFVAYILNFLYHYFRVFERTSVSIHNGLLYFDGHLSVAWAVFSYIFIIIEPVFIVLCYILLTRYKKRVRHSFSSLDKINLNWLRLIFNVWLISAVVMVPISTLTVGGVGGLSVDVMHVLLEVLQVAFLFILGFYGFKQTNIFSDLELATSTGTKEPVSYERSGLDKEQAADYHRRLLVLMQEKKPYLNGELSAGELAQHLTISVNHLSQILNTIQHQNFFDFVNGYRVREVIEKMKDPKNRHLTLLAIALESGFNSKTSFNTVFRKVTNQTPSQYYKSLSSENTPKTA